MGASRDFAKWKARLTSAASASMTLVASSESVNHHQSHLLSPDMAPVYVPGLRSLRSHRLVTDSPSA
jgi:hypothetical protein